MESRGNRGGVWEILYTHQSGMHMPQVLLYEWPEGQSIEVDW
jgi:hypothetical protein